MDAAPRVRVTRNWFVHQNFASRTMRFEVQDWTARSHKPIPQRVLIQLHKSKVPKFQSHVLQVCLFEFCSIQFFTFLDIFLNCVIRFDEKLLGSTRNQPQYDKYVRNHDVDKKQFLQNCPSQPPNAILRHVGIQGHGPHRSRTFPSGMLWRFHTFLNHLKRC